MLNSNHKLILFDIDGTLVLYRDNFPHRLFEEAMLRFFSKTVSLEDYRFSGKTDKNIVTEISMRSGVSKEQLDDKVMEVLEWIPTHLAENVTPNSFTLLPNVDRLLVELASQPDTTLALLTGNLPKCAEIKLHQFDLFHHFEFGAYGHELTWQELNYLSLWAIPSTHRKMDQKKIAHSRTYRVRWFKTIK